MKKSIQSISIEARLLADRLSKVIPSETIPYSELSELIGRDVQKEGYGACMTARNVVLREYGLVFSPVIKVGLKCLTDEEVALSGDSGINRIKRIANKEKKKLHLGVKDFDALSNDAKIKHNTSASIFGAFGLIAQKKMIQKIESAVESANSALPSMKLLKIFK